MGFNYFINFIIYGINYFYSSKRKNVTEETRKEFAPLIIREPSEYDDEDEDDYHTELDRSSV